MLDFRECLKIGLGRRNMRMRRKLVGNGPSFKFSELTLYLSQLVLTTLAMLLCFLNQSLVLGLDVLLLLIV